jgi:hypothetical protein
MSRALLYQFRRYKFSTIQACNVVLIEHLDGRAVTFDAPRHSRRRLAIRLLVDMKFLRVEKAATLITELGREALAAVLAEYAEILQAAGMAQKAA